MGKLRCTKAERLAALTPPGQSGTGIQLCSDCPASSPARRTRPRGLRPPHSPSSRRSSSLKASGLNSSGPTALGTHPSSTAKAWAEWPLTPEHSQMGVAGRAQRGGEGPKPPPRPCAAPPTPCSPLLSALPSGVFIREEEDPLKSREEGRGPARSWEVMGGQLTPHAPFLAPGLYPCLFGAPIHNPSLAGGPHLSLPLSSPGSSPP